MRAAVAHVSSWTGHEPRKTWSTKTYTKIFQEMATKPLKKCCFIHHFPFNLISFQLILSTTTYDYQKQSSISPFSLPFKTTSFFAAWMKTPSQKQIWLSVLCLLCHCGSSKPGSQPGRASSAPGGPWDNTLARSLIFIIHTVTSCVKLWHVALPNP